MSRGLAAAVMTTFILAAAPAADAGSLELRLGGFIPRADSNLFDDDSELYTVGKDDWRGFSGGVEWSFDVAPKVELGFHLDAYERKVDTVYRDFINDRTGNNIPQTLALNIVPLGTSVRLVPLGRRAPVSPYVSAGVDVFFYRYEEYGEFIDFFSDQQDIIADAFISEGAAFGFHVAGGVRVPIGRDFSLVGEVRYQNARTDMSDDFRGFQGERLRVDLSGTSVTIGGRLRF
jgi:opacity protein-like surface antigen